jgi:hypothetical protein
MSERIWTVEPRVIALQVMLNANANATHDTWCLCTDNVGPAETSSHQQAMTSDRHGLKWGDTPGPQDHHYRAEEASTARDRHRKSIHAFWGNAQKKSIQNGSGEVRGMF